MRILFLQGWHSVPCGVKPNYLKDHGHEVITPALCDDNLDAALATAQAEFNMVMGERCRHLVLPHTLAVCLRNQHSVHPAVTRGNEGELQFAIAVPSRQGDS